MTVVKIQQPLFSTDPNAPWLIYDQGKTNVEQIPRVLVPSHVLRLMGDKSKAYFNAKLIERSPKSVGV